MDAFYGEIRALPYTFAPQNWALCDGSLMAVQQNAALFALLGTYYGGNGTTNFGLPNLMGSVAVGVGQDPSDSFAPDLGETGGTESVTLLSSEMPMHNHVLQGAEAGPKLRVATPAGNLMGNVAYVPTTGAVVQGSLFSSDTGNQNFLVNLNVGTLAAFGGGQPHENRQPFLTVRYNICVYGIFPSRE